MNISALISRLVDRGIDPVEAGEVIALAFAAGAASAPSRKTPGAMRTERWRTRHKASQCDATVTPERATGEASQSVTKRHKASQCDDAPIEDKNISISNSSKQRTSRGTRLRDDWAPDDVDRSAASSLGLTQGDVDREAPRFRDYWIGKSGQGACKVDWRATWRNWCRTTAERLGRAPPVPSDQSGGPKPNGVYILRGDPRFDAWEKVLGKSIFVGKGGGYLFPSDYPPAASLENQGTQ